MNLIIKGKTVKTNYAYEWFNRYWMWSVSHPIKTCVAKKCTKSCNG